MRQHKRNLSDPSGESLLGHDGVRGVEEPRSCPGGDDTRRALLFCPQQGSVLLAYTASRLLSCSPSLFHSSLLMLLLFLLLFYPLKGLLSFLESTLHPSLNYADLST